MMRHTQNLQSEYKTILVHEEENNKRKGRQKKQKITLPPTDAFSSSNHKQCTQLSDIFIQWGRFIYLNPTNGKQNKVKSQFDAIQQETMPDKCRIATIQKITAKRFKFNNIGQTVVFFYKQNHEKNPMAELKILECLNRHNQESLSKIYQQLNLKFFKDFVRILYFIENNTQFHELATQLLSEAYLSEDDNTIIQCLFIRHCYSYGVEIDDDEQEIFNQWQKNHHVKIIADIIQFFQEIKASLEQPDAKMQIE